LSKSTFIHVGTFGSPVGLKGEIKINCLTTNLKFFKNLNEYIDETFLNFYIFNHMRLTNNKIIAHPIDCLTREDANKLKGKKIFSKSSNFPKINQGEYYVKDLIGSSIYLLNGEKIGKVINVDNFGAGDLIEVKVNDKSIYIPMDKENLISVDLDSKKIVVNPIEGIID